MKKITILFLCFICTISTSASALPTCSVDRYWGGFRRALKNVESAIDNPANQPDLVTRLGGFNGFIQELWPDMVSLATQDLGGEMHWLMFYLSEQAQTDPLQALPSPGDLTRRDVTFQDIRNNLNIILATYDENYPQFSQGVVSLVPSVEELFSFPIAQASTDPLINGIELKAGASAVVGVNHTFGPSVSISAKAVKAGPGSLYPVKFGLSSAVKLGASATATSAPVKISYGAGFYTSTNHLQWPGNTGPGSCLYSSDYNYISISAGVGASFPVLGEVDFDVSLYPTWLPNPATRKFDTSIAGLINDFISNTNQMVYQTFQNAVNPIGELLPSKPQVQELEVPSSGVQDSVFQNTASGFFGSAAKTLKLSRCVKYSIGYGTGTYVTNFALNKMSASISAGGNFYDFKNANTADHVLLSTAFLIGGATGYFTGSLDASVLGFAVPFLPAILKIEKCADEVLGSMAFGTSISADCIANRLNFAGSYALQVALEKADGKLNAMMSDWNWNVRVWKREKPEDPELLKQIKRIYRAMSKYD